MTYFQSTLDPMTSAMARLNLAIGTAEAKCYYATVELDEELSRRMAELWESSKTTAEYDARIAPVSAEYLRLVAPARDECERAIAEAQAEYERASK